MYNVADRLLCIPKTKEDRCSISFLEVGSKGELGKELSNLEGKWVKEDEIGGRMKDVRIQALFRFCNNWHRNKSLR